MSTGVLFAITCFVLCEGAKENDVRLVDGLSPLVGRVEIYYNGSWGTVCDDLWHDVDASVVCNQLGLGSVGTAIGSAQFGEGSGPIWLDDVGCSGNEIHLASCPNDGWGVHNCAHREDAGVVCSDVRLVEGPDVTEGRVEVYHNGTWGFVCDDFWDDVDAGILCKQLRYSEVGKAISGSQFGFVRSGTILLDDVKCLGNETSIFECDHLGLGVEDCTFSEVAGARCKNDPSTCSIDRCINGGSCIDLALGYFCVCPEGYGGKMCELETSPCFSNPCLNGGGCIAQPDGYFCLCDYGRFGRNCENSTSFSGTVKGVNGTATNTTLLVMSAVNAALFVCLIIVMVCVCVVKKRESSAALPVPPQPKSAISMPTLQPERCQPPGKLNMTNAASRTNNAYDMQDVYGN